MSAEKEYQPKRKEARKEVSLAILKMFYITKNAHVVDMVRGMEVFKALGVLKFSNKAAAEE